MIRILHITDFHISNPDSQQEFLREDYFKNYIDGLTNILQSHVGNIDCVVATGDFIDKGKVANFSHAKKVLEYICYKLNLNEARLGTCIGNHDILVPTEDGRLNYKDESRESYNEFEKNFYLRSENLDVLNPRFKLVRLFNNVFFLSLDATLGRDENKPGKLRIQEIDPILKSIQRSNLDNPENLLIVGCHYPLTHFENTPFPDEEGWYDAHFWRSGTFLKERLKNSLGKCQILWLFGDTHYPSSHQNYKQLFVMSGRIGTKSSQEAVDLKDSDKILSEYNLAQRQARVIEYSGDNLAKIYSLKYSIDFYSEDSRREYSWKIENPESFEYSIDTPEVIKNISNESRDLEKEIYDEIKKRNLYKFGRFVTREDEVSLGWVSINGLLSERNTLLSNIIQSSSDWIKSKLDQEQLNKTLLIGVNSWGSVIASHLSVSLNLKNLCRSFTENIERFTHNELFNDDCFEKINLEKYNNFIIITDVVSSGRTIKKVYDLLFSYLEKKSAIISKTLALCILSDRLQEKKVKLEFLSAFGTHCGSIRIPVVTIDTLPDENLLPPYSYRLLN